MVGTTKKMMREGQNVTYICTLGSRGKDPLFGGKKNLHERGSHVLKGTKMKHSKLKIKLMLYP